MTRAGKEPAEDIQRRRVQACKAAGLVVKHRMNRLLDLRDGRYIFVADLTCSSLPKSQEESAQITLGRLRGQCWTAPGPNELHDRSVFMIGPEANHFVLVSGRENFVWRHGRFGDLIRSRLQLSTQTVAKRFEDVVDGFVQIHVQRRGRAEMLALCGPRYT